MEHNKSLSARIRRRNKQGFEGIGTYFGVGPYPHPYGDYTDSKQNGKEHDYKLARERKSKLGFKRIGNLSINKRALTKKIR